MSALSAAALGFHASTPVADIATRTADALTAWGFIAPTMERLGSLVRVVLADGPALAHRLAAAVAAVTEAGLAVDVHPDQRAIVAYSSSLATVECPGCDRGRCIRHGSLFAELEI